MTTMNNHTAVITGASSGIGRETALALAAKGANIVLGARREDRLQELAGEIEALGAKVAYKATDVSQQADVEALVDLAKSEFGRVDTMINNAGLMPLSFLSMTKTSEWDQMIDVNIKGVLYGIAAVINDMRAQGGGHIINIASIAGHVVFPTGGVYCATKHAVRALTEALRQEEQTIRATVISPGLTDTELPNTISDPKIGAATQAQYQSAIPASSVANAIVWAMEQPADVDINEVVVRPVGQRQ